MRLILPIALLLGLVVKVLHLPFHTVFLLVVLAVGLVWIVSRLIRDTGRPEIWTELAVWAWCAHLVAMLKLFPFRMITFTMAVVMTVVALYILLKRRPILSRPLQVLAGVSILVLLAMAVPIADRFHFTNLRFSLERDTDHVSWDKYSFFLAREGRKEEALAANARALEVAQTTGTLEVIDALEARRASIGSGTWDRYHPLIHEARAH